MEYLKQEEGIKRISELINTNKLIPIFGAGFSMNNKTKSEYVPDSITATKLMQKLILESSSKLDSSALAKADFNQTAKYFYSIVPPDVRNIFFETYFTDGALTDLSKSLLSFDWPYAYTLNIDDSIERNSEFKAVLPYKNLNKPSAMKLLYKLHGDAYTEVTYATQENIIFSEDQYIQSITSRENKSFLNNLIDDFSLNNLIFIGCSLINEPDLRYIWNRSDHTSNPLRIYLTSSTLTYEDELNLLDYGINTILQVDDYNLFYEILISEVSNLITLNNGTNYRYINPIIEFKDSRPDTIQYLSGITIFDSETNKFYKSGMQVIRSKVYEIEKLLETNSSILLKGRRFSGKTYILSSLCERQNKYTKYFFPSSVTTDEKLLYYLINEKTNSLFIFDSNSLAPDAYKLLSNSREIIIQNKNKIIIAINTNDNFITEALNAEIVELSNQFDDSELAQNKSLADKYGIIKRFYNHSNLDYLVNINKIQHINSLNINPFPRNHSKNEQIILLLLTCMDKVYYGDALALGISMYEIKQFLKKFPILIEEMPVEISELSTHSSLKLIHNSKVTLMQIIGNFSRDDLINCITYIVEELKDDQQRYRIYIELILFDTLNQLFGGKKGAGHLIFDVYSALEPLLNDSLHYWLQRAKSIYRILGHSKNDLQQAYEYSRKVYFDGWATIKSKSALTTALICCRLYELEYDTADKELYLEQSITYSYESIFSDYYKINTNYLNNELKHGKNLRSSYDMILTICQTYIDTRVNTELCRRAQAIIDKIKSLQSKK